MSLATFLPVAIALGIAFIPVWLLRHRKPARARDHFVASQATRLEVARNASIAYSLRIVAFVPLFVWGVRGDFWPAIIGAASFALGVYLIHLFRRPLLAFMDGARNGGRSITVHAFIAQRHGNDPRVRVFAASLTVFALLGLLAGEGLVLAFVLAPVLPGGAATACALVFGMLLLAMAYAMASGPAGVMHAAQVQLGMLYLGLFGSMTLLLYLQVSALAPMPPHGTLAVVLAAACCAAILWYRRTRYIDTDPIRRDASSARAFSRAGKVLNVCVSILLALVIVVATMALYASGSHVIVHDSAAALTKLTSVPASGLVTLCLLPLLYPLVDVATWQMLGAVRIDPDRQAASLRGALRIYAAESALVALLVCFLGAIAAMAIETPDSEGIVARLAVADDGMTAAILPLLLICVAAAALSTMSALFSATLYTIRHDLLTPRSPSTEAMAERRTLVAASGLALAFAATFCMAEAILDAGRAMRTLLAVLFALCCAQLSFAPLVLGPIAGRTVGPGWALLVLGVGAAGGIACVTVYLATGVDAWLWAAVPACLGSGALLFAIAGAQERRA